MGSALTTILITYLLSQMIASIFVIYLLLGTHWAETQFFTAPEDKQIKHGWYHHNFVTACDWRPPDYLWRLTGRGNHLTHHIFPHWHHRHYPALARISVPNWRSNMICHIVVLITNNSLRPKYDS
ncbi:hypothetical protein AB6G88_01890 [Providencia hangzhouensis]